MQKVAFWAGLDHLDVIDKKQRHHINDTWKLVDKKNNNISGPITDRWGTPLLIIV